MSDQTIPLDPGGCLPGAVRLIDLLGTAPGRIAVSEPTEGLAGLVDLAAALGCERLDLALPDPWPATWCWGSTGGTMIPVGADSCNGLPVHAADLPPSEWDGRLPTATWAAERSAQGAIVDPDHAWQLANPHATTIGATACLPGLAEDDHGAVRDQHGRRWPTQPVDADLLVAVELDAGADLALEPADAAPDTTPWTVGPTVIDNGILRAEFDHLGGIARLCLDGRFVEQAGPLLRPTDGAGAPIPELEMVTSEVLAQGPVRAVVAFHLRASSGATWSLRYELDRGQQHLGVTISGTGPSSSAHLPLGPSATTCRLRWDLGHERLDLRPDLARPSTPWRRAWRSAACDAPAGKAGLALIALAPVALRPDDHGLHLAADGTLHLALGPSGDPHGIDELRTGLALRHGLEAGRLRHPLPPIRTRGCLALRCTAEPPEFLVLAGDQARLTLTQPTPPRITAAPGTTRLRQDADTWTLDLTPRAIAHVAP